MERRTWPLAVIIAASIPALACGPSTKQAKPADTAEATPPPGATETSAPPPGDAPPPPQAARQLRYRFDMEQPENDDWTVQEEDVFLYIRPFEDYLSFKVQGRKQRFIQIYWDDCEFEDILGRRYKLVPPGVTIEEAALSKVPPTEIPQGQVFAGRVLLLDPTDIPSIRRLGGRSSPTVPDDAGTPEQIRGRNFYLRLAIDIDYVRRDYRFVYQIQDIYYR